MLPFRWTVPPIPRRNESKPANLRLYERGSRFLLLGNQKSPRASRGFSYGREDYLSAIVCPPTKTFAGFGAGFDGVGVSAGGATTSLRAPSGAVAATASGSSYLLPFVYETSPGSPGSTLVSTKSSRHSYTFVGTVSIKDSKLGLIISTYPLDAGTSYPTSMQHLPLRWSSSCWKMTACFPLSLYSRHVPSIVCHFAHP